MRFQKKNPQREIPADPQQAALRLLKQREHSQAQLRSKLKMRGCLPEEVDQALSKLRDGGLQSDARFAELLIRSRSNQGYGPVRLRAELSVAGVPRELVEQALADCDINWLQSAEQWVMRKFGGPPAAAEGHDRCYRLLQQRGYPAEVILAVLGRRPSV